MQGCSARRVFNRSANKVMIEVDLHRTSPTVDQLLIRSDPHRTSPSPDPPMTEPLAHHNQYPDEAIRRILRATKSIALVGASANPARPSYIVLKYLKERGYQMFAINPGLAGQTILDVPVYAALKDLPQAVDMVEIFRNSEAAGPLTDEALALSPLPKVIWMQLSVRNDAAALRAEAKGVEVIMNRCPKIEYGRISGEIGWQGINSRMLSSKKPVLSAKGFQKLTIAPRGGSSSGA